MAIFYRYSTTTVVVATQLYLKGMDILSTHYHHPRDEILHLIDHLSSNLRKWVPDVFTNAFSTSLNEPKVQ